MHQVHKLIYILILIECQVFPSQIWHLLWSCLYAHFIPLFHYRLLLLISLILLLLIWIAFKRGLAISETIKIDFWKINALQLWFLFTLFFIFQNYNILLLTFNFKVFIKTIIAALSTFRLWQAEQTQITFLISEVRSGATLNYRGVLQFWIYRIATLIAHILVLVLLMIHKLRLLYELKFFCAHRAESLQLLTNLKRLPNSIIDKEINLLISMRFTIIALFPKSQYSTT